MNLSLKNRIGTSFIVANLIVLILGFTVFYYLDTLNKEIQDVTLKSNKVALLTDEIRISAVSIIKYQRKILVEKAPPEQVEKLVALCESFQSQLQSLDSLYSEVEIKKIISKMMGYVDSLKLILSKSSLFHRDNVGLSSIGDLADKILEAFSEFQDIQYYQSEERDLQLKKIISETKRNMMITLIITFLGTILMGLIVPGKIALPFKKINDAIRELQDCNFDVTIYYDQDDEIGEMAREMNKMIHNFKIFDELRTDRISLEQRKFDALANLVKKYVMVANSKGELIYMNNPLYSLLKLQSDDIIHKNFRDALIPESIKNTFDMAIKRRSKIENEEVEVFSRISEDEQEKGKRPEEIFKGFGTVIPIRGKDSSLDYYLMVLSSEVIS